MPDSWIDREDLDDLVGGFATSRKVGRKRTGTTPPRIRESLPPSPREAEQVEATALSLPEHGLDGKATGSGTPADEATTPATVIDALGDETHEAEAEIPPTPPPVEELPEILLGDRDDSPESRELPQFLDDRLEPVVRPLPSLSERDADRALNALAEARSRAERSRLLRVREPSAEVSSEVSSEVEGALVPEVHDKDDVPVEDAGPIHRDEPAMEPMETIVGAFPLDEESVSPDETGESRVEPCEPLPTGQVRDPFRLRVERFGDSARRQLDAIEMVVCDSDGFPLYSHADPSGKGTLETALLLEISGRANRLLGIDRSAATQVSAGGGLWRCLLRGGESGGIFAGILLRRPLERDEIEFWSEALAAAFVVVPRPSGLAS